MTDTAANFLGIPIDGDIIRSNRKDQKPLEDLAPLMQAVLDDPTIAGFGWTQYTPYFNDGDACEFSVSGDIWVRTVDDEAVEDTYELDVDSNHPSLGKKPSTYNRETRKYDVKPYEGPDEARHDRCHALNKAIAGGEFEDVLLKAFGDHAEVTVKRDGITVEHYSHE